jgi:type IV fimbrial biogenesis protein FimT
MRQYGFTLPDAVIACALIGILAALAAPAFQEVAMNGRRTTQVNALLRALHLARSSAIRRAVPVAVCKSMDGTQCAAPAASWSDGYVVFANEDRDSPPRVDAGEEILLAHPRIERMRVSANRDAIVYWPVSMAGTTASIVFCDDRGASAARAVIVSHTGRPRIAARDASGRALRCT